MSLVEIQDFPSLVRILFIIVGVVVWVIFRLFGFRGFRKRKGKKPKVLINVIDSLFSLVGITMVSIGTLFIIINIYSSTDIHTDIQQIVKETIVGYQSCLELESFNRIGPFQEGRYELGNSPIIERVAKIIEHIKKRGVTDSLSFILIVGSADKQPLNPDGEASLGSNIGLAQARANEVKQQMLKKLLPAFDTSRIIVLISGPDNIGADIDPQKLAEDRCVRIYAGWNKPVVDTLGK